MFLPPFPYEYSRIVENYHWSCWPWNHLFAAQSFVVHLLKINVIVKSLESDNCYFQFKKYSLLNVLYFCFSQDVSTLCTINININFVLNILSLHVMLKTALSMCVLGALQMSFSSGFMYCGVLLSPTSQYIYIWGKNISGALR